MKKLIRSIAALVICTPLLTIAQEKKLLGYTPEATTAEFAIEKKFDAQLKASDLDEWMKKLSSHPHHLGSPYGKINAEYIRTLFAGWGFDAKIETYKVLFPTPVTRVVEMTGPSKFKATLTEPGLKEDATSNQLSEQLPVYNAWSADGDVTAELVFVNYGVPDDYEQLERMGIDVKGKIVIAKYGGSWRGIKPKVAQEHGAIGCLIYSDPKDDGYYQGDVYPKGPFKNQYGAQRGSVMDLPVYPGDPLTPEIGATENAKRLDRLAAPNLLKIPVLPISYSDAQPLLVNLGGPVAPERWRGALPMTYHIGPGTEKVHLKLKFDWKMVDCYNVIAVLKGSDYPDEWVIRGNHHDGWVNGANDPISGLVAELEEAKALNALTKTGWKPKRTIIYCAWDGEEPGLIGSTEWAEDHAKEIQEKTVAYINTDDSGRGFLGADGSHTLETLVGQIARDVNDPQTNVSVFERLRSYQALHASSVKAKKDLLAQGSLTINALGSGSDYSAFIQHLGVPSLNIGYGGEDSGGEYHSIYDSYDNYVRFKDPGFLYGITLAQTSGRAVLRLANATVLPFDFKAFQKTVSKYATEVNELTTVLRESTETENQLIREHRYELASDPTRKFITPLPKDAVPFLNFSALQNAVLTLEKSAAAFDQAYSAVPFAPANVAAVNHLMYRAEQSLITTTGLPRRGWYKHTIYAPGYYTGYGVKTLPGIREAIEQRNWKEAQEQIDIAAKAITNYTTQVDAAAKLFR